MKKIITLILTLFIALNINPVYAEVTTYERNTENNYGVNKKWQITDNNIWNVNRTPYVNSEEKIYDFADILTDEEEQEIYENIKDFIEDTNMDMVILTIDMPYNYDSENEDYAADFYDYNDFGIDFENYSGVLFLRNANLADPYFDIYTFGNAQLYFTYERLENTLDDIYYDIKNQNYLTGFNDFIIDMNIYYDKGIPSDYRDYYVDEYGLLQKEYVYHPPILVAFIISTVVTAITMIILTSKNKMVKVENGAREYLDTESIKYNVCEDKLISSHTTSRYDPPSSSSSSGGGGHSSSSGSSGGGHSSGGGRHG